MRCSRPWTTVYPRVCGGTRRYDVVDIPVRGLSPRVRGNLLAAADHGQHGGSIPACAGEPWCGAMLPTPSRVYPRVCGGTPSSRWVSRPSNRSIPACAGEPCRSRNWTRWGRVYPRVCGGTALLRDGRRQGGGLSPRVRGNPSTSFRLTQSNRSIPACAGEPASAMLATWQSRVYPRVCGGTGRSHRLLQAVGGLSPRVRGNLESILSGLTRTRSIPACAGEPAAGVALVANWGVYPRVCGGTSPVQRQGRAVRGLSPRVRGNHGPSAPAGPWPGSIPACAGEPGPAIPSAPGGPVYPRVCGGTSRCASISCSVRGLSPRVRGNRSPSMWTTGVKGGEIPAHRGGAKVYHQGSMASLNVRTNCSGAMSL